MVVIDQEGNVDLLQRLKHFTLFSRSLSINFYVKKCKI